jgi:Ca-activated chloride channel family protein
MKLDMNDSKWTAYAFGELDAEERAVVEAELRANPEAQQLVSELQKTGEFLKSALAREPVVELTGEQRAALAAAVSDSATSESAIGSASVAVSPPSPSGRHRRRWVAVLGVLAASGLIAAVLVPAMQRAREASSRVAKSEATKTAEDGFQHHTIGLSDAGVVNSVKERDSARAPLSEPNVAAAAATPSAVTVNDELQSGAYGGVPYGSPAGRVIVDNSLSLRQPGMEGKLGSGEYRFRTEITGLPGHSATYTINKPLDETSTELTSKPQSQDESRPTDGRVDGEAGGLIGPAQIEFLEGLDQIVIRGHPRDVERTIEIIREIESKTEPGPVVGDFAAAHHPIPIKGKEAEVGKLVEELRQIQGRNANEHNTGEAYDLPPENPFEPVASNPLSTFSIDVDTASYANIRRFLTQNNHLPPPSAVRIEEMINYFRYNYPQPDGDVPFSVTTEVATCPWHTDHRLVRVGLKGKEIAREKRPVSNLVFLLDVSGSMEPANKLPLVREVMKQFVRELAENDRVAIVVYAGASGMVLDSTTGDQKDLIISALDRLHAGGSTNGAGGLQQAYDVAMQHFIQGGTNRVILATDGDFNVGITDRGDLVRLIEEKAKSGVFLTTLGFGMGNLKDATLEQLADKGNGNYAYIDSMTEGRKVLVEEMSGTLVTIAKDVKVQIEFNPAEVASYRLIGYENRRLAAEDFNDDKKDAGEIGAGHTVTALYELVPVKAGGRETAAVGDTAGQVRHGESAGGTTSSGAQGQADSGTPPAVDPLRYQKPAAPKVDLTDAANSGELFTLKLRYKQPDGETSRLLEHPVKDSGKAYRDASGDFKFAASVAAFGMTLRHSQHRGTITLDGIKELAQEGRSFDPGGYRSEFSTLIEKAQALGAK